MVHTLTTLLQKPCGVVINKETEPYEPLETFCAEHGLPILDRIPYDPALAQTLAAAELAVERLPAQRERFTALLKKIGGAG